MLLRTDTVEETDIVIGWAEAKEKLQQITKILANKHNAQDQIKAIRKLLRPPAQT